MTQIQSEKWDIELLQPLADVIMFGERKGYKGYSQVVENDCEKFRYKLASSAFNTIISMYDN